MCLHTFLFPCNDSTYIFVFLVSTFLIFRHKKYFEYALLHSLLTEMCRAIYFCRDARHDVVHRMSDLKEMQFYVVQFVAVALYY